MYPMLMRTRFVLSGVPRGIRPLAALSPASKLGPDALFINHCSNDLLDPAERLLVTWMGHFDKLEGVDALVARLCDRESMKKDRSYKLQDKPDDNLFREGFPSMDSWHALMSMYAGRQAGYHCKAVFNFLNLIETQISNAIAGDALAQATPYVTINSYRVPRNIKSDERIHKDYLRALCGTESFASAFQLLVRMVGDQHMMPDAHSMVALLRMVNKPGFVKDSTIPRICDLTTNLVVDMHRLDVLRSSGVEAPATVQLEKSSDTCMVLNYLITVLCTRGYVELAVSTIEKLKLEGVEIDHVGAEIVIRTLSLVGKTNKAMEIFHEQCNAYTESNAELKARNKLDARLQRSYHAIVTGLRKENKLKDAASFILENGRFIEIQNGTP